ncbi:MAG: hypothetical protein P8R54_14340 [Myxococcota bacterium]|nr:hypothetical protein [Myxococcota bacterium]
MPRPFFPHTLHDVVRNVDGPLGLIAADMPDGSLFVLKRDRRGGGYRLTHYADTARSAIQSQETVLGRKDAINLLSRNIGLGEYL